MPLVSSCMLHSDDARFRGFVLQVISCGLRMRVIAELFCLEAEQHSDLLKVRRSSCYPFFTVSLLLRSQKLSEPCQQYSLHVPLANSCVEKYRIQQSASSACTP